MKIFSTLAVLALTSVSGFAADHAGAIACLRELPAKFRDGVLKLSADDAAPNPATWYLVVRENGDASNIHHLTMTGGQIASEGRTLGLREIFSGASPVSVDKVSVDSGDAFGIVQKYAAANGEKIKTVSFALQQSGEASALVWSVWCYGPSGSYLGLMKLLATDGAVIYNNAFPNKP